MGMDSAVMSAMTAAEQFHQIAHRQRPELEPCSESHFPADGRAARDVKPRADQGQGAAGSLIN